MATHCTCTFTVNFSKDLQMLKVNSEGACWDHVGHPLTEGKHI